MPKMNRWSAQKVLSISFAPASAHARDVYLISVRPHAPKSVHHTIRSFAHPPQVETRPGESARYMLTGPSLWNFAARGGTARHVLSTLRSMSEVRLPSELEEWVRTLIGRYGSIVFRTTARRTTGGHALIRIDAVPDVISKAQREDVRVAAFCYAEGRHKGEWYVPQFLVGRFRTLLGWLGYPVVDKTKRREGQHLPFSLRHVTRRGARFSLRPYQKQARAAALSLAQKFGHQRTVFIGPSGVGKTIEGIALAASLQQSVLIVTVRKESVQQWIREFLDKTTLTEDDIGEYTSDARQIRPVTVTTYQMLTAGSHIDGAVLRQFEAALHRGKRGRAEVFRLGHLIRKKLADFDLLQVDADGQSRWGLLICDEVDHLPADHWRIAAQIEAGYALGLTATPIREDGRITEEGGRVLGELFNLMGPIAHDLTYPEARAGGWIAPVQCYRVDVPLNAKEQRAYRRARNRHAQRDIAWHNANKVKAVHAILRRHPKAPTLVIGHFLRSLGPIARAIGNVPYLNGSAGPEERAEVHDAFRAGRIRCFVTSSIGDRAVDFPDAMLMMQVNGHYGSRPQEGQRIGRILRPKPRAVYYNLVTPDTPEEEDADKRQAYIEAKGFVIKRISLNALLRS